MNLIEKNKTSLVILVWDEIEAIQKIWNKIPFNLFDEVFFMDPGSTDGTIEFVKSKNFPIYIQKKPKSDKFWDTQEKFWE